MQILTLARLLCLPVLAFSVHIAPLHTVHPDMQVPGEWLLLLQENSDVKLSDITDDINLTYGSKVSILNQYDLGKVRVLRVASDDKTIHHLRSHKEVSLIEANAILHPTSSSSSPQPPYSTTPPVSPPASSADSCIRQRTGIALWGLSRIATMTTPNYGTATYDYMEGDGEGVDVYIMDSGINIHHEEFEGRAVWGMTVSDLKEEGDEDLYGHGTHVAGTVGGKTYGVAKKAKLIAVKLLSSNGSSTHRFIEGIAWVRRDFLTKEEKLGRRPKAVINYSLSGSGINPVRDYVISKFIDIGLQIVIAAGNDYLDACNTSDARISSAITVGATNIRDKIANFSNYGPCVNILAPGEYILSAYIGNNTASKVMQGTSMATPHVTGMVARYLSQQDEGVSPFYIKVWLLDSATFGKIRVNLTRKELATPNRLLYGPCDLHVKDEAQPTTNRTQPSSTKGAMSSQVLIFVLFPLVQLILFVVILIILVLWVKYKLFNVPSKPCTKEPALGKDDSRIELLMST